MMDTDDTRRVTTDGRRTTPQVWHKLPTSELKKCFPSLEHIRNNQNQVKNEIKAANSGS